MAKFYIAHGVTLGVMFGVTIGVTIGVTLGVIKTKSGAGKPIRNKEQRSVLRV